MDYEMACASPYGKLPVKVWKEEAQHHLLLREEHLYEGLAYGLESVAVYVLHVVVDGVPRGTEGAGLAVRIIRYDVDARNLGLLVDWQMVVGNRVALVIREETAEACHTGSSPHFANYVGSIVKRHALLIESGSFATHHVEKDAITIGGGRFLCGILLCPVLST